MYTTSWGILALGIPSTVIAFLLLVVSGKLEPLDGAYAAAFMVASEVFIAGPILFIAKRLSRHASQ